MGDLLVWSLRALCIRFGADRASYFCSDLVGPQCLTGGSVHWIRLPSPLLHSLADVDGEGQPAEELINLADGETTRAETIPAAASRRRGIVVKRQRVSDRP